ncbi:hypothetical protein [Roseomonas gilardii]|uniref:hypothetical protein n=1 Tax=Roseomonas gilardii TaxID=257708 RepID=UPI00119D825F|nr:hypothetical protein [Roseomonas gilardii]
MREALPHPSPIALEPEGPVPALADRGTTLLPSAEEAEARLIRDWLVVEGIQRLLEELHPDMLELFGEVLEQAARDLRTRSSGPRLPEPLAARKAEGVRPRGRTRRAGASPRPRHPLI